MSRNIQNPTFKQKLTGFGNFIYNKKDGVLGRDSKSWAKIGAFYLIYYGCLAGFFSITMIVFYQTIDDKVPKLQGDSSLLKGNPGLGFRPVPKKESSLMRFTPSNENSRAPFVADIDKILKKYREVSPEDQANQVECSDNVLRHKDEAPCKVNMTELKECVDAPDYGYAEGGKPCVVLKLNKVFGWVPKEITGETLEGYQATMRQGAFTTMTHDNVTGLSSGLTVTCVGENAADRENIKNIEFFPKEGFSYKYFPYYNQPGYLAPLLMVRVDVTHKVLVMIECKLWADGISHDRQTRKGLVHFEILIEE